MSLSTYPLNPEVGSFEDTRRELQRVRRHLSVMDDLITANAVPASVPAYNDHVLLGNDSGGVAAVQEITLDSSLAFTGSQVLQRAALTGAVTASAGSNATSIATDAVTTVKILDDNVTYAKIQNVVDDERILGRVSGADGVIEELTKAQVLTMINVADGANAYSHPNHTGNVTSSGDGATTIATAYKTYSKIIRIDSPATDAEFEIMWTLDALTVREIRSYLVDGTDYKFNIDLRAKATPFTQRAAMFTADQTATASTSTTHSPNNEPTAGDVLTFLGKTGGTGTPSKILLLIAYTID